MTITLNNRYISIIICCIVFCFSSKVFALDEDFLDEMTTVINLLDAPSKSPEELKKLSTVQAMDFMKELYSETLQKHFESKEKNFNDLSDRRRVLNLYLNSILDYIISSNKDFLEKNNLNISDTYIKFNKMGLFGVTFLHLIAAGSDLFSIDIQGDFSSGDTITAAAISHELSHSLLNHTQKYYETYLILEEIKTFEELLQYSNENSIFDTYVQEYKTLHPNSKDIKALKKHILRSIDSKHEIEADTLGLELYLNAGFSPEMFKQFFLNTGKYKYDLFTKYEKIFSDDFTEISDKDFKYFKELYNPDTCVKLGKQAKDKGDYEFKKFMNHIQFIPNYKDVHPTECWRYWNINEKILEKKDTIKNNKIINAIYSTLDTVIYEALVSNQTDLPHIVRILLSNIDKVTHESLIFSKNNGIDFKEQNADAHAIPLSVIIISLCN